MSDARSFWETFCSASGVAPETPFQTWFFGNNFEQARELAELVINGSKRATASLVAFNEIHPEVAPIVDGYSVVTDFDGKPMCVIRTTEIRQRPFNEVDAEFAFDEGEGDRTLEYWREGHRSYFSREALENDLAFSDSALICCERFELLFSVEPVQEN
jgi:uncharacterized protein YhfF